MRVFYALYIACKLCSVFDLEMFCELCGVYAFDCSSFVVRVL